MEEKKNKGGRPKEGLDTLPEDWYEHVLELYAEGGSDVEVKAMIWKWRDSFSDDLWKRWMEEEPLFSSTIKKGRSLAKAWWHSEGRTALRDDKFSYTGWYMQMKNRFGWSDKQQIEQKVDQRTTVSKIFPDELDGDN
jgi:hypothetical protein